MVALTIPNLNWFVAVLKIEQQPPKVLDFLDPDLVVVTVLSDTQIQFIVTQTEKMTLSFTRDSLTQILETFSSEHQRLLRPVPWFSKPIDSNLQVLPGSPGTSPEIILR